MERFKTHVIGGMGFIILVGIIGLSGTRGGFAQHGGNGIQERVAALEAKVAALEQKTQFIQTGTDSITGTLDMYITGTNLHIENGTTDPGVGSFGEPNPPTINGKGNLIIGFNQTRNPHFVTGLDNRTGSHNLIVGTQNNYSSFGGLVAGAYNDVSNKFASITGGIYNTAAGFYSSVSGGINNTASGHYSSVTGGGQNEASGLSSSISGGQSNLASNNVSSVSGGFQNTASGMNSSISGGRHIANNVEFGWLAGSLGSTSVSGNFHSP